MGSEPTLGAICMTIRNGPKVPVPIPPSLTHPPFANHLGLLRPVSTEQQRHQSPPDIRPLVAGNRNTTGTRENPAGIKAMDAGLGPDLTGNNAALGCPPSVRPGRVVEFVA